jgi:hypothetical protein
MEFVVGLGVRILHRHPGAEIEMRTNGFPERSVGRHAGLIERSEIQLDKAGALLLGDLKAAVHVDQVIESQLFGEAIRAAEGLRGERSEMIDMFESAGTEKRLQNRIGQDTGVEDVFQVVQGFFPAGVLKKRGQGGAPLVMARKANVGVLSGPEDRAQPVAREGAAAGSDRASA